MNFILFLFFCYGCLGIICCFSYKWCFRRVNRPNYSVIAGEYCIERIKNLPRREFFYNAGRSTLKGYFYPNKSNKLIVVVHGFRSGADDFLPLIKELSRQGFNVFAFDQTGTYDSKGKSILGACQYLIDLDNTLEYIKASDVYNQFDLYLLGHSLGGYAVLSALSIHKNIKGCIALAPVNNANTLMVKTAQAYLGVLSILSKPFFSLIQKISFGKYTKYTAIKGINSTDIPVLIVQGDNDKIVKRGKIGVSYHKNQILNFKVRHLNVTGVCGGHSQIWHSEKGVLYKNRVDCVLKKAKFKQKIEYCKQVNHELYSQVNRRLVTQMLGLLSE